MGWRKGRGSVWDGGRGRAQCRMEEASIMISSFVFIDLADNEDILKFLQFVGGGKKLQKIPSGHITNACMSSPLFSPDLFNPLGPPSPTRPFSPGRARFYTIDIGQFQIARARSKSMCM